MGIFTPSLSTQQTQVDVYSSQYIVPENLRTVKRKILCGQTFSISTQLGAASYKGFIV